MPFTSPYVVDEVDRLRRGADARHQAWADNLEVEERLESGRIATYEAFVAASGEAEIDKAQPLYFQEYVQGVTGSIPVPFDGGNALACVSPGDDTRRLTRLEDLSSWLDVCMPGFAAEKLEEAFRLGDDAILDSFVAAWNGARTDERPMFATFRDDLHDILLPANAQWAADMRAALGLGHFNTHRILVGRMEYTVAEVLDPLSPHEQPFAFAAPTAIDQNRFCEHFHPFPGPASGSGVSWGSAVHLRGKGTRLVNEFLHRRLTYRRDHLVAVDWLEPEALPSLKDMRDTHVTLLRSSFPGFGRMMP